MKRETQTAGLAEDFRRAVERGAGFLPSLTGGRAATRPASGGWSAKETLGHLVDSAANNHQRFVRARFKDDLVFDGYEQDQWVAAQRYADAPWPELVELWRLYNLHLARLVSLIPEDELTRPRHPHSLHRTALKPVGEDEPATLAYLVRDYVEHLEHHLSEIRAASGAG